MQKRILCFVLILAFAVALLTACGEPKAPSHDDIVKEIQEEENEKAKGQDNTDQNNQGKSDLKINVAGKDVTLPFDLNVLLQSGYTFVDSEQEQKIKTGVNEEIDTVLLTNENEKMETMYGSPYLNVDVYCGSNANDIKVISVNIQSVEKKFASINGFGWNDRIADLMATINHNYDELVGTNNDNINSGEYVIEYTFSDVVMDVYAVDGLISLIDVKAVQ